jgi:ribosome-associated protein
MKEKTGQDSQARAKIIEGLLNTKKGEDIKVLDVRKRSDLWDFFVICSGLSTPHVKTLFDTVSEEMGKLGHPAAHRDTGNDNKWIILDYGDILVHIFDAETRRYYSIETMWGEREALAAKILKRAEKAVKGFKTKKNIQAGKNRKSKEEKGEKCKKKKKVR